MWAYDDSATYFHSLDDDRIVAVSLQDGSDRWRANRVGSVYAAGGGRVLVMGGDLPGRGDVHGLSVDDASIEWTRRLPLVGPAFATSAAVDERLAVVAISNFSPRD